MKYHSGEAHYGICETAFGWLFGVLAFGFMGFTGEALAQSRSYDISGFDPSLRASVEAARDAQQRSIAAAARAQFDMPGTVRFKGNANDSYEGEGYGSGEAANRHGNGLLTWADGEFYAG